MSSFWRTGLREVKAETLGERLAELNDKALLGDLANWPTEVGPLDAKRTLAGVKEKALVVALGDMVTEYQADTLIERIFKVKAEELVDALADTLAEEKHKPLSEHWLILRLGH